MSPCLLSRCARDDALPIAVSGTLVPYVPYHAYLALPISAPPRVELDSLLSLTWMTWILYQVSLNLIPYTYRGGSEMWQRDALHDARASGPRPSILEFFLGANSA